MKNKKVILSIISIILIMIPTEVFAWLAKDIYYACNKVNTCISVYMRIVAVIIGITYITIALGYIKYSGQEKKQKTKNVLKWLAVITIQIIILLLGSLLVTKVGIEPYWHPTGERYQFNEIDGYISNSIRIIAFASIIIYTITSIIYYIRSKKGSNEKIINLARWQILTILIVVILLLVATKW